jgi:hypothetical protein
MPYQGNGAYHSYNNGAIWKIGNNRGDNTGSGEDNKRSKSNPSFQNIDVQTSGVPGKDSWGKAANYLPDNTNFIISTTSKQKEEPNNDPATSNEEKTKNSENEALNETPETNTLDDFKKASENAANTAKESLKKASITDISNNLLKQAGLGSVSQLKGSIQASTIDKARAKANAIATGARETMEALLAQELNKIREALNLSGTGLTFQTGNVVPNVYKGATFDNPNYYKDPVSGKTFYNQRLVSPSDVPPQPIGIPYSIKFYDVRAQLTRFVGDSLGDRFYSAGE